MASNSLIKSSLKTSSKTQFSRKAVILPPSNTKLTVLSMKTCGCAAAVPASETRHKRSEPTKVKARARELRQDTRNQKLDWAVTVNGQPQSGQTATSCAVAGSAPAAIF